MRGKDSANPIALYTLRITPAYAGKRKQKWHLFPLLQDHPRLCGEKAVVGNHDRIFVGSPPPMRGKAPVIVLQSTSSGITPAYAGKSDLYLQTHDKK